MNSIRMTDLALIAALELEKAKAGRLYDKAILRKLADALEKKSKPGLASAPYHLIEPGYLQPFERLFRLQGSSGTVSGDSLKRFIERKAKQLRDVEAETRPPRQLAGLIDFCLQLHRELTRSVNLEDAVAITRSKGHRTRAAARVGTA